MPRYLGNLFVTSRARFVLYRTPPFNEFYGKLLKCSLYRGIVNNRIYKTQHFRIWIHSYGTRDSRTGKQNSLKLLYTNFFLFVLFGFHLLSHADIHSLYPGIFSIWACAIVFVITRISLQGSVPYTLLSVILSWRKSFVIPRTSLYRGSFNRRLTVKSCTENVPFSLKKIFYLTCCWFSSDVGNDVSSSDSAIPSSSCHKPHS